MQAHASKQRPLGQAQNQSFARSNLMNGGSTSFIPPQLTHLTRAHGSRASFRLDGSRPKKNRPQETGQLKYKVLEIAVAGTRLCWSCLPDLWHMAICGNTSLFGGWCAKIVPTIRPLLMKQVETAM